MAELKSFRIETRSTVWRHYVVEAKDKYDALKKFYSAECVHEEDEDEETMSVVEAKPND